MVTSATVEESATIRGVSEIHTTGNLSSPYFDECQSHETGLIAEQWYSYICGLNSALAGPIQVYPRHLSPPAARGTRGIFIAPVLVNVAADLSSVPLIQRVVRDGTVYLILLLRIL